jgi:hypothetical protein
MHQYSTNPHSWSCPEHALLRPPLGGRRTSSTDSAALGWHGMGGLGLLEGREGDKGKGREGDGKGTGERDEVGSGSGERLRYAIDARYNPARTPEPRVYPERAFCTIVRTNRTCLLVPIILAGQTLSHLVPNQHALHCGAPILVP